MRPYPAKVFGFVLGTWLVFGCGSASEPAAVLVVRAPGVLVDAEVQVGSVVVGELDYPMPLGGVVNGAFHKFLGESPFDDLVELRVRTREQELPPGTYEVRVEKRGFV